MLFLGIWASPNRLKQVHIGQQVGRVCVAMFRLKNRPHTISLGPFLGAKSTSILDCVGPLVGRSVGWSVPHDAITWKTGYVAIASRGGEGRGN